MSPTARDNIHTLISADRIDYLNGYQTLHGIQVDTGRIEEKEGFYRFSLITRVFGHALHDFFIMEVL